MRQLVIIHSNFRHRKVYRVVLLHSSLPYQEDRWLVSSLQIITAIHWNALSEKLIQIEYENF